VVTDWRRFLGAGEERVLPYLGGPFVDAADRRLRVQAPLEPGWWRFAVSGRTARPLGPAERPALEHLPKVRGHVTDGYLVAPRTGQATLLEVLDAEEPPRFAPLVARVWPPDHLLADTLDFEGDAEETARRVFEDRGTLAGVRGVPSSLRAAFGFAVCLRLARERGVPVAPAEVRAHLGALAGRGDEAAAEVLDRLVAERARARALDTVHAATRAAGTSAATTADPVARAEAALRAAGASLTELRRLDRGLLEVRWRFAGERFSSIVEERTLGVVDAGICLAGSDRLVTLESLPAVVREAAETDALTLTRWA
jgi:hypothetical protein